MVLRREPAAQGLDLGSPEASLAQRTILRTKPSLRRFYVSAYRRMQDAGDRFLSGPDGIALELGSGGGFMRNVVPDIVTSDIKPIDGVDQVIDGQRLPFDDASIRLVYAMHVIHHIPDVEQFLGELDRVVPVGGGLVAIEPYWSPLARLCYSRLHPEPWEPDATTWTFESTGPLSSNQALSYLLLERDRAQFDTRWPQFEVLRGEPFGGPSYLLTGGIWRTPVVPDPVLARMEAAEARSHWWRRGLALHHTFVLRKRQVTPGA